LDRLTPGSHRDLTTRRTEPNPLTMFKTKAPATKTAVKKTAPAKKAAPARKAAAPKKIVRRTEEEVGRA
jgi:hypothetical protein